MKRIALKLVTLLVFTVAASSAMAVSSSDILKRVKAAEAGVTDFRADMVITEADKKNVSGMGEGYGDILKLQKAIISYKKPSLIRMDGYAQGIKMAYVQNGYTKLILAAMIRQRQNVKNAPGKRQDTLDLGFLSSQLWKDNNISIVSNGSNCTMKLKFVPKFGDQDKRHDMVWIDAKTLKVLKREKHKGSGEIRVKYTYEDFYMMDGKLPIATTSNMFNSSGDELGSVRYKNIKVNSGLNDSLFSLSQR